MSLKLKFCCLSILFFGPAKAQKDSLRHVKMVEFVYSAQLSNLQVDTADLRLDSVIVKIKRNTLRITTTNFFMFSNRSINIDYYFENDSLKYVLTFESDFEDSNKSCFSDYYIENEAILYADRGSTIRNIQTGAIYSKEQLFKRSLCSNRINYSYLDEYIFILLNAQLKVE